MLSRVADNLYWMNRYVERAESVIRLVEVNQDTLLEIAGNKAMEQFWFSALQAFCAEEYMVQKRMLRLKSSSSFQMNGQARLEIVSIPQEKMPEWSEINYRKKFGSNSIAFITSFEIPMRRDFSKEILDSFIEDY